MTGFDWLVAAAALVAGAVASIAGFGIGSILTPLLSVRFDIHVAVAVVSIPHISATILRLWKLRAHLDRQLLLSFGAMNAAGALAGALLQAVARARTLEIVLGLLLVFAGTMVLLGLTERVRLGTVGSWFAGALAGLFGGLVGNQGGIRSAALLGLGVRRDALIATATAIALGVDLARMPVYLARGGAQVEAMWPLVAAMTVAALVGTLVGERLLRKIPERMFRKTVAVLLVALGAVMLARER